LKWFGLGSDSPGATARHEPVRSSRLLGAAAGYVRIGDVSDSPDRLR